MDVICLTTAFGWSCTGAIWDVASGRIPNKLSYSGILAGILLRTWLLGWHGLLSAVVGGLLGGGIFFAIYLVRGMGAGDVKLMAAAGSIAGAAWIGQILLTCALAGGVMAVIVTLLKGRFLRTLRSTAELLAFRASHGAQVHPTLNIDNPESIRLPYAVAIAAGTLCPLMMIFFRR